MIRGGDGCRAAPIFSFSRADAMLMLRHDAGADFLRLMPIFCRCADIERCYSDIIAAPGFRR